MSREPLNLPLERKRIEVEQRVAELDRTPYRYLSNAERDELGRLRAWVKKHPRGRDR